MLAVHERLAELVEITRQRRFTKQFPNAYLITTEVEIREARRDGLPKHLIPFFVQLQPTHRDYYVFNKRERGIERSVGVFAVHTVVFGWDTFGDFLDWMREMIG